MTIEITLRSGKKAILNRERMTFTTGDAVRSTFPLFFWPIVEHEGTEICDNSSVVSWREIPDEPESTAVVPELPVLPSTGVHDSGRPEGEEQSARPELSHEDVRVPSEAPVPNSGTDWIK